MNKIRSGSLLLEKPNRFIVVLAVDKKKNEAEVYVNFEDNTNLCYCFQTYHLSDILSWINEEENKYSAQWRLIYE